MKTTIEELEQEADAVEKSLDDKNKKEEKPEASGLAKAISLLSDSATALKSMVDEFRGKKPAKTDNGEGDEKPVQKSGETRQPKGDQNELNNGEMVKRTRVRVYNYDAKMQMGDVEDWPDTHVDDNQDKRNIRKSVDEGDEDQVFEVTDFLHGLEASIKAVKKGIEILAKAQLATINVQKALMEQGNEGRGRMSALEVVDKSLLGSEGIGNGKNDFNPQALMTKALRMQREDIEAGRPLRLDATSIASLEIALNEGQPIAKSVLNVINSAQ